eukprot:6199598-Pleurochrysis_carterae.AAC.1
MSSGWVEPPRLGCSALGVDETRRHAHARLSDERGPRSHAKEIVVKMRQPLAVEVDVCATSEWGFNQPRTLTRGECAGRQRWLVSGKTGSPTAPEEGAGAEKGSKELSDRRTGTRAAAIGPNSDVATEAIRAPAGNVEARRFHQKAAVHDALRKKRVGPKAVDGSGSTHKCARRATGERGDLIARGQNRPSAAAVP